MSADVAAVIVTHNSAREIQSCLRSLNGLGEIVVVDNASLDDTCLRVQATAPEVLLVRNDENLGFAAAVNQGIRATTNPFLLLLNPDTILRTSVDPLVRECLLPEVGAAAGRLVDAWGKTQIGFNVRSFPTGLSLAAEALLLNRLWPSNPVNRRFRRLDFDPAKPQSVEQPAGAFLMVRRDVIEATGYLDEGFHPIWFEDVDLCLRIDRSGYAIRYLPSCVAEHGGAHSIQSMPLEQKHLAWYGNLLRFSEKHFSSPTRLALWAAAYVGLMMRWSASVFGAGSREERRGYRAAMRLVRSRRPGRDSGAQVHVRNPAASRSS